MERLTELIERGVRVGNVDYLAEGATQNALLKLAEYEEAEEQGLLVRMPCKVGDKVFLIEQDKTISKWFVAGFRKYHDISWCAEIRNNLNKWRYIDKIVMLNLFGKIIFLTKAEALQALKKEEE